MVEYLLGFIAIMLVLIFIRIGTVIDSLAVISRNQNAIAKLTIEVAKEFNPDLKTTVK
jgi:hypothetical protein